MLLALALPARAEKAATRPEFLVNKDAVGDQGRFHGPAVSSDAAGNFVVVWENRYGYYPDPPGIFGRRLDRFGRRVGREFRVSGADYVQRQSPAVASAPAGGFLVVWEDYYAILARRYSASGAPQGAPFEVRTTTAGFSGNPKVAADGAGNFVVVWQTYDEDNFIRGQRFDGTGARLGGEFQVNTDTSCCPGYNGIDEDADGIEVAANGASSFMVVWEKSAGGGRRDIRGRFFDDGAAVGGEFVVQSSTPVFAEYPGITRDGAGRFIVGWQAGGGIFARRFDAAGTPLGPDFQVGDGDAYGPKLAADTEGNFVVVWGPDLESVFGREFDATGTPVGGEFRIDDPTTYTSYGGGQRLPDVAASAAGDFVVVWLGEYADGDGWGIVGAPLGEKPAPCSPTPLPGCRGPTVLGKGLFRFKAGATPEDNVLVWQLERAHAADPVDFGDPFATDSYAFCVYDASSATQPIIESLAPAGGGCGNFPCWRTVGRARVSYTDKARFAGGLEQILLKPGADGVAGATVRAKRARLTLPEPPLSLPVTVQLQGAHGECWSGTYGTFVLKNEDGVFKARPDV
jgi:hypothetical protein